MGVFLSIAFGLLPMLAYAWFVYWLDRYEKEPKILLGVVFVWGAIIAAGAAFVVNTLLGMGIYLFTRSEAATSLTTGVLVAPVVEETLKGIAILVVFWIFREEFDSLLDGLIYAAVAALGFAATENAYYIYQYGYLENGMDGLYAMVFIRAILVGWQHPFYTAFTGIGLAVSRMSRQLPLKLLAPVAGWTAAIIAHAIHNMLIETYTGSGSFFFTTAIDWTGWIFMFLVVLWAIRREQSNLSSQLWEEVEMGLITPAHYHAACSPVAQNTARITALFAGSYPVTKRFYQTCAELAHKKMQYARLGDERGNTAIIESLREELSRLAPLARS